jgi:exopolysaccharide production protein ExoQ
MPPTLAALVWLVLLILLLVYDPAKQPGVSVAIWVPIIWIFFVASRLPSQWLGGDRLTLAAQAFEEGNSFDRSVFLALILLAMIVLVSRSFRWGEFFVRNLALTSLLLFALVSIFWSDLPFVSLKRWVRDLGSYLSILVVLSDPVPLESVRLLLRRLFYLLVPLSILVIKYYPILGMDYSEWTGAAMAKGVATSKNTLGAICLVSGLFFFWDIASRWSNRKEQGTKRILAVNFVFLAMTLWLLNLAHSATSGVCMAIGCVVVVVARSKWAKRHPGFFKILIPASFCLYLVLAFGLDLNGELARLVGRDPTLTDRTDIWRAVLNVHTNPLVGTGYESFWLGPRLDSLWRQKSTVGINEAHNGYLEVYLNLGLMGVFLLAGVLIAGYRSLCRELHTRSGPASLGLAMLTVTLFYNMTEAAFIGYHLMWAILLIAAIAIPGCAERPVEILARNSKLRPTPRFAEFGLGTNAQRRQNVSSTSKPYPPLR